VKPLVIDTSIWIDWARAERAELLAHTRNRILLMPAIVAMELLSGAKDRRTMRVVDRLLAPLVRNRRVVLPAYDDYALAGAVMADLGWPSSRRSNDVLIAVIARKTGAALLTANRADFAPTCSLLGVEML
jgi:predicted nucleic acid-binding protein